MTPAELNSRRQYTGIDRTDPKRLRIIDYKEQLVTRLQKGENDVRRASGPRDLLNRTVTSVTTINTETWQAYSNILLRGGKWRIGNVTTGYISAPLLKACGFDRDLVAAKGQEEMLPLARVLRAVDTHPMPHESKHPLVSGKSPSLLAKLRKGITRGYGIKAMCKWLGIPPMIRKGIHTEWAAPLLYLQLCGWDANALVQVRDKYGSSPGYLERLMRLAYRTGAEFIPPRYTERIGYARLMCLADVINHVVDTIVMVQQTDEDLDASRFTPGQINYYHDQLTMQARRREAARQAAPFPYTSEQLALQTHGMILPVDGAAVVKRADEVAHNCIASYTRDIRRGAYLLFDFGEANVGVRVYDGTMSLSQAYRPYNKPLHEEEKQRLLAWAKEHKVRDDIYSY